MRIKTIKTLFITLLMFLGSVGAWAVNQTITLADIDFSNSIVTSSSSPKYTIEGNVGKMTWDGQWTVTPYLSDGVLRFGNFTGTVNLADGIEQSNGVVTVSFDLAFGKLSKKQIGFSFLDSEGNYIIEQLFDAYNGDFNDKNPLGLDWSSMYRGSNTVIQDRCVYFTIIFDYNTSKITTKTKCYLYGTGRNATEVESIVDMTNTNYISSFRLYGNINNAERYSTFDNFKITTETYIANNPTIELAKVQGTSRIYRISFDDGDVLHYKIPGSDEYLTTMETPFEVTLDVNGTLSAYTTYETATSEVVETEVTTAGTTIALSTPRISLYSYNVTETGALEGIKFKINAPDNSSVELTPGTEKLEYTFTPDGGVESERFEIEDGFVYEPTVFGVLKIYANTVGYDGSFLEIPVSNYYINNYTYNYDGITAELFEGKANWKTVESGWWEGAEVYRCTDDRSHTLGRFRFGNNTVTDVVLGWGIGRSDKNCEFQLRNRKSGEINILDIHTNTDGTDKSPFTQMTFLATSGNGGETDLYPKSYLGKLNTAKRLNVYTPSGKYEIKDVFIGSLTSEGNDVVAEDFESMESLSSSWEINEVNSIGFSTVENVESPEVGSAPIGIPTYVSGKTFRGYIRQGSNAGERFSSFNFGAPLDKGKIMFSADFFSSGNVNTPIKLRFIDKNGNSLFSLGYENGSSFRYLYYTIDGSAVQTSARSDYRNYAGFGIKDMAIDFETGDVSFTFDCINRYGVREHVPIKFNIGTGKNIAKMQIGKAAISSTDLYYHLDNVKLYTVGLVTGELNYTVAAKCGDDIVKTIKTGTSHGGKVVPITGMPLVVENNGNFYTLDDAQVEKFSSAFQMNYVDYEHRYNYVVSPEIVYFNDGEKSTWGYENSSASGGYVGSWGNKTDICSTTLDAGLYDVIINVWSKAGSGSNYRRSAVEVNGYVEAMVDDNNNGEHVLSVLVPNDRASFKIYGRGTNKATDNIDYVLVRKTGDLPSAYTTSISSAGVSTLCSPYNLDFTDAQNVAAYKAEIDEENGKIRLEKVTTVAAREGVLIRSLSGEAVTEDVPASASAFEVNEGNDFIGTLVNINNQASEDEEYRYYILGGKKNAEGNMVYGFYLAGGKNIGAGKAYLKVPKSAAAKFSFFALEDETTGIEDIHAVQHDDTKVYDLSGRRVVKPSKGLYIKNGKKFIVK